MVSIRAIMMVLGRQRRDRSVYTSEGPSVRIRQVMRVPRAHRPLSRIRMNPRMPVDPARGLMGLYGVGILIPSRIAMGRCPAKWIDSIQLVPKQLI
jgi:hypothetical protein